MKPYIVCHISSALDGKVEGKIFDTQAARTVSLEYARIRSEYGADAWCYGTKTTQEFTYYQKPELNDHSMVEDGDHVFSSDLDLYYVSIDPDGIIGWNSNVYHHRGRPDSHVIEVLTSRTSMTYRAYLNDKRISYIIAGEDHLDLEVACEKLYQLFGIKKMLVCGGGTINYSFLHEQLVDELSLLLMPCASGDPDDVTVFERMSFLSEKVFEFKLKTIERLKGDGVRLVYLMK